MCEVSMDDTITPENGIQEDIIRIPVATSYDLDNDYDYIMSRALKSYRQHREKEKADSRKGLHRNKNLRRFFMRPKTAPPAPCSTEMVKLDSVVAGPKPAQVFMPKIDAIGEVEKANPNSEDAERSARRVLQVAKVSISMLQTENKKAKSYMKRNSPSHPWHSHSYPSVKPMEKFVRPPHCYMSASVGEREMSSALSDSSSSRSSSNKNSPQHITSCGSGRPKSASASQKSKYYYDGGLFTHPKNSNHEYFVIHPDWVSESMSIQKLSLTERTRSIPKSKSSTWPGRRCNSAPPAKYRNPITWETTTRS